MKFAKAHREVIDQGLEGPRKFGKPPVELLLVRAEAALRKRALAQATAERTRQAAYQRQEQAKLAAERKTQAEEKLEQDHKIFKRYDKDRDSLLSPSEARSYAKREFDFEVPPEVITELLRQLSEISGKVLKGVALDAFHDLKVAVGVARELARDRQRLEAREEEEARKALEAVNTAEGETANKAEEAMPDESMAATEAKDDSLPTE